MMSKSSSVNKMRRYMVSPEVLALAPDITVYLFVAKGLTNRASTSHDQDLLLAAQRQFQAEYGESDIRLLPSVAAYRGLMERAEINPNRFPPSIEAMLKRIAKGGQLPSINTIVDRCNMISILTQISLGAHDMRGIEADLALRMSRAGDRFLPMGSTEWETIPAGELSWSSGDIIQTRRGLWRQSELGKTELDSQDIYFHLVSFAEFETSLEQASVMISDLIQELGGEHTLYRLNKRQPEAEWPL